MVIRQKSKQEIPRGQEMGSRKHKEQERLGKQGRGRKGWEEAQVHEDSQVREGEAEEEGIQPVHEVEARSDESGLRFKGRCRARAKLELRGYKVLGGGMLARPITVKASGFSKKAMEKIKQAGGQADPAVMCIAWKA